MASDFRQTKLVSGVLILTIFLYVDLEPVVRNFLKLNYWIFYLLPLTYLLDSFVLIIDDDDNLSLPSANLLCVYRTTFLTTGLKLLTSIHTFCLITSAIIL